MIKGNHLMWIGAVLQFIILFVLFMFTEEDTYIVPVSILASGVITGGFTIVVAIHHLDTGFDDKRIKSQDETGWYIVSFVFFHIPAIIKYTIKSLVMFIEEFQKLDK